MPLMLRQNHQFLKVQEAVQQKVLSIQQFHTTYVQIQVSWQEFAV